MAQAGYCSECKANVWLTTDGTCPAGHGAECISNVYEASPAPAAPLGDIAPSADMKWLAMALAVVLLIVGAAYLIHAAAVAAQTQSNFALNNPTAASAAQQAVVNGWETNGWLDSILRGIQGLGCLLAGVVVLLGGLLLSRPWDGAGSCARHRSSCAASPACTCHRAQRVGNAERTELRRGCNRMDCGHRQHNLGGIRRPSTWCAQWGTGRRVHRRWGRRVDSLCLPIVDRRLPCVPRNATSVCGFDAVCLLRRQWSSARRCSTSLAS